MPALRGEVPLVDRRRFVRLCGLAVIVVLALENLRGPWPTVASTVQAIALIGFALAYVYLTRPSPPISTRSTALLIAAQGMVATFGTFDLFIVIAAELPLVLNARRARQGLVAVLLLNTLVIVAIGMLAGHSAAPDTAPSATSLPLAWISALVWELFAFGFGAMAAVEASDRRALEQLNADLAAAQAQLADQSRLAERLSIARELHDSVGHHLTALSVQLELARQLTDGRAADVVTRAGAMTRAALDEVRAAVDDLRQPRRTDLRAALEELTRLAVRLRITLAIADPLPALDAASVHTLYRFAQEALTNAVRHSRAHELRFDVHAEAGGVSLRACDDGVGCAAPILGNGLTGLRERLAAIGGRLDIRAGTGAGFEVAAWLPLAGRGALA